MRAGGRRANEEDLRGGGEVVDPDLVERDACRKQFAEAERFIAVNELPEGDAVHDATTVLRRQYRRHVAKLAILLRQPLRACRRSGGDDPGHAAARRIHACGAAQG